MKLLSFCLGLMCACSICAQQNEVVYTESNSDVMNPGRGFYRYTENRASDPVPLTLCKLNDIRVQGRTLIFRYFYLDEFFDKPIDDWYLEMVKEDFEVIRDAGFKVIPRFAYTSVLNEGIPFNDTPNENLVLQHIGQLGEIIMANSDVILTLQNGFYGVWGENYYSDVYGCECNETLDAEAWGRRKKVTDALLSLLPENRVLSVRYPILKSQLYGFDIPADSLTFNEANSKSVKARIGYHNDCFLVAHNDYTFNNTVIEKLYWQTESRYTVMGGETCGDTETYSNCDNAMKELDAANWTYLNDDYHPDVLKRWQVEGCFDEIELRLGYRLCLTRGVFDRSAERGGLFKFEVELKNSGFAAMVNYRPVFLVFKKDDEKEFKVQIDVDPRKWYSGGSYLIAGNVQMPSEMASGEYDLYLWLPDEYEHLRENTRFSVQFANEGTWETFYGYNNLGASVLVQDPVAVSYGHTNSQVLLKQINRSNLFEIVVGTRVNSVQVNVFCVDGRRVGNKQFSCGQAIFNLDVNNGIYILSVCSGKSRLFNKKVVVEQSY